MNKYLFTDTNGNKSLTATVFVWGCLAANLKLLLSGVVVGSTTLSTFSGVDYAAALSALGGIYILRRQTPKEKV